MKTLYAILFVCLGTFVTAIAQSPVPEPDTLKNQVRQIDPVPQNPPLEANYTHDDKVKIMTTELPDEVKRSLKAGPEYSGWEKGTAYKSKDGKNFVVEMREADTVRTFRFDKTGKLILD